MTKLIRAIAVAGIIAFGSVGVTVAQAAQATAAVHPAVIAPRSIAAPTQITGSWGGAGDDVLAADNAGDIVAADTTYGRSSVTWLKGGAGGYAPQQDVYLANPANGTNAYVKGLALDSSGDIFASTGTSVVKIPKSGSGYGAAVTLPFGGLVSTTGVAVDTSGNVFVNSNGTIDELTKSGAGYGPQVTLGFTAISITAGPAVDSSGDVYVLGTSSTTYKVEELPKSAGTFGSPISIAAPSIWSVSQSIGVDGAGDVFLGGLVFTSSFSSVVEELPAVGSSHGSWQSVSSLSGTDSHYVSSTPAGNVFLFSPFLNVQELSGLSGSYGAPHIVPFIPYAHDNSFVADAQDDLFILSSGVGDVDYVVEEKNGASGYTQQLVPLGGLGVETGTIAMDPAGDLFIDSGTAGTFGVSEYVAGASGFSGPVNVPFTGINNAGLSTYGAIAVDTAGDVFLANGTAVLEVPKSAGSFGSQETLPFTSVAATISTIGVDTAGDVFAEYLGSALELPKQGTWFGSQVTLSLSTLYDPVVFDRSGNLFARSYDGASQTYAVVELPWSGSAYGAAKTLSGWSNAYEVPVDAVFVGPHDGVFATVDFGQLNSGTMFGGIFKMAAGSISGIVSSAKSTVTASPTTVSADGSTTSTVTVTLKDGSGAAVAGRSVTLTQGSGTHAVISAASGVSNTSGQVTFTVKDSTAEAVTLTATDGTDGVTVTQTAQVTFTAPLPTTHLVVTAPIAVSVGKATTVTVTAANASGGKTPAYRGTVKLTSSDGSATLPASHTFTAGDAGSSTFSVTLNTAGQQSVTATDTGNGSISGATGIGVEHLSVTAPAAQHSETGLKVTAVTPSVTGSLSGRGVQWSATGLPGGLTINSSSGAISGTPTSACSCSVTVKATDGTVTSTSATFTWTVVVNPDGYWLVGSDGGIFTFGTANFYGSTGNLTLQRPVVGITPTSDRKGYWLVASDGGIFAFGDSGFYGSIPGIGLAPAGSSGPGPKLAAPIVGMVPSIDGHGYFMVAADGGVFAFGDAKFAGSCPGIGGCSGAAVAVMPDATGKGYWLVTASGNVYTFGDATNHGQSGARGVPVTSAVRTPTGNGYWILFADGAVSNFGDAKNYGSPALGGANPAAAIFATSSGTGYWVAGAQGGIYPFGSAPNDGSMAGTHLNAPIIAASGW